MLRFFVLLLVLANAAYFAYSHGMLASVGFARTSKTESQRLQTQTKTESIRPVSAGDAARLQSAAVAKPTQCLQTPLLDEKTAQAARAALEQASVPAEFWSTFEREDPARWIVYMGKYPDADTLAKKKSELRQRSVAFEALKNTALEPGISLGGFDSKQEADAHLVEVAKKDVRTARVVQESPKRIGQALKFPAVDAEKKELLDSVKSALGNVELKACSV